MVDEWQVKGDLVAFLCKIGGVYFDTRLLLDEIDGFNVEGGSLAISLHELAIVYISCPYSGLH